LNLSAQLGSRGILINSRLIDILNRYEVELNDARVSLLLLTAQSVLAVLYAVGMVSSFLLEQARHELSTMAGRGFSAGQVTRLYGIEALLLSFGIAFPLGPPLAFLIMQLWSRAADLPFSTGIPTQSWLLALAAALFGLLAVTIPIFIASRRQLTDWAGQRVRPPQRPTARRLVFDLILLALGGLAYWQLRSAGTLTQGDATNELLGSADPILLLGPTLLVLALGLVILRLFPFLLQGLAFVSQTVRSLILPLGLSRLARDPAGPSRILLLICLTAGLTLFATVFRDSIQVRQVEMARYRSGADIRVIVPLEKEPALADIDNLLGLEEGLVGSMVYRNQIAIGSPEGRRVDMIAVDPKNFAAVSAFPQGISQFSLAQIMNVLAPADFESDEAELIPAVFSIAALPAGYANQDIIPLSLGDQTWGFQVRGIINEFPTVDEPFIVVNINELEKRLNVTAVDVLLKGLTGRRELWLAVPADVDQPALVQAIRQSPAPILGATAQTTRIVGDAQNLLTIYRANLIARESIAAFNINAIILAILSSVGFLLIQIFAARRRMVEFGVLRALGLSNRGLLRLLTVEAAILLVLGILMGIGIGFGLAALMRPFMSTILADSLGGDIVDRLILNPVSLFSVLFALFIFYAAAMLMLLYSLSRSDLQRVLRLGDE
ncbi:MAG: ABC transporter permease, partial [Anaerolineales bacterium]|nr:ABC transporter permease [Anaerolineales bacterium]